MAHRAVRYAVAIVAILLLGYLALKILAGPDLDDLKPEPEQPEQRDSATTSAPGSERDEVTAAPTDANEANRRVAQAPTTDAADAALPPMPASELRFALQFDDLLARAKAGDPVASCRLVLDTLRCADWERSHRLIETLTQSLSKSKDRKTTDLTIEALAKIEVKNRDSKLCDDFDRARLRDLDQLGPMAFARLSPRQKLLMALSTNSGELTRLPKTSVPNPGAIRFTEDAMVLQFMADHDRAFIADGLAARDPLALEAAMLLHAPRVPAGMRRVYRNALPDPLKFAFYARLSKDLLGEQGTSPFAIETLGIIEARLSATQRLELDSLVQAELPSWRAAIAPYASGSDDIDDDRPATDCN